MTSAQSHTTAGSRPLVSGQLAIFSILEESVNNYETALTDAVSDVVGEESEALKDQLSRHPDWSDKVDDANVSYNNGHLEYSVDHPDAVDLEYGNPMRKVTATGVLRSIAKRREYDVNQSLMRHLSSRLPDA